MIDTASPPAPPTARTGARWLGAIVAAAAALAVWVALGALAYSFYEIYGPDRAARFFTGRVLLELGYTAFPFILVATALVAGSAAAVMALATRPRRKIRVVPLVGLSLLLTAAVTVAGAWIGTTVKQDGQERAASACSPDEHAALASLGTPTSNGRYGHGMPDGSCRGFLAFAADNEAALAEFRAQLAADGWRPEPGRAEPMRYTRNGKTMDVTVVRDKALEVTVSFP